MKIKKPIARFIPHAAFFLAVLLSVAFLWEKPKIAFLALLFISVSYLIYAKEKDNWKFFIAVGISGCLSEILCIKFGAWQYGKPEIMGIPFYLTLVWGMAGLCFRQLYKTVKAI